MSSPHHTEVQCLAVRRAKSAAALIGAMMAVTAVYLSACTTSHKEPESTEIKSQVGVPELAIFTLTEGKKSVPPREKAAQNTSVLPDDVRSNLLGRLPVPKKKGAEAFKLPEATLQPLPPKAGTVEKSAFPPPAGSEEKGPAKPSKKAEPLKIIRHVPESGEVNEDTTLCITFNQPMVALSTIGQVASKIPVTLNPMPKGEWKWLGTSTLTFVPENGKLPGSTQFEVDIPAGITSSTGTKLDSEMRWSFRTPTNRVIEWYPGDSGVSREPTMLAVLAQPVDPESFVKFISVKSHLLDDKLKPELKVVSEAEAKKDPKVKAIIERIESSQANPKYWIAFKSKKQFPGSEQIQVTVPAGLESSEGPLRSNSVFSEDFYTYGDLKVSNSTYSGRPKTLNLSFTNALKQSCIKRESISVSPKADFRIAYSYDSTVQLSGNFKSNTSYTVTLKDFEDVYGQKLARGETKAEFGRPEPFLDCQYGRLTTIERSKSSNYAIHSAGIGAMTVNIYEANPSLWNTFQQWYDDRTPKNLKVLASKTYKLDPNEDDVETIIDLKPFLKNGYGQVLLSVNTPKPNEYRSRTWLQFSDMGVDAFSDHKTLTAWVTNLRDGKPLGDVEITVGKTSARTDKSGIARLPETHAQMLYAKRGDDMLMLPGYWTAQHQPINIVWYGASDRGLYRPGEQVKAKGWVRTRTYGPDSKLQLPTGSGLTVEYEVQDSRGNPFAKGKAPIDEQGGFDLSFTVPTNCNLGQAQARWVLKRNGVDENNYVYSIGTLPFDIQTFRRPEFEMRVSDLKPRSLMLGESGTLQASAHYYSGGSLGETPIKWTVKATPGRFAPAGWDDYYFAGGDYKFLREKEGVDSAYLDQTYVSGGWPVNMFDISNARLTKTFEGITDFNGEHVLDVNVANLPQAVPLSFEVEGTVEDKSRQSWTDKQTLLFHPANVYVGLKNQSYFVQEGQPLDLSAIVTDLDGKLVTGKPVELEFFREVPISKDEPHKRERKSVGHKNLTSGTEPVNLTFNATNDEGDYIVVATVRDDENRASKTELRVWCAGSWSMQYDGIEQSQAKLMLDKKQYAKGDTANIMVVSPFAPFHGLMTVEREGIFRTIPFESDKNSCTVQLPIDESCVPNASINVELVGNRSTKKAQKNSSSASSSANETLPAFAVGNLSLSVPPRHHSLSVSVKPVHSKLQPGGETSINLNLKNAKGEAVASGQVAVAVVDESVLALSGYRIQTPLDTFYTLRSAGVSSVYGRNAISVQGTTKRESYALGGGGGSPMLQGATNGSIGYYAGAPTPTAAPAKELVADSNAGTAWDIRKDYFLRFPVARQAADSNAGTAFEIRRNYHKRYPFAAEADKAGGQPGNNQPKIALRSNFDALAAFVPVATTDKDGNATIKVKLPDSLTRYRVMAVAAAGKGEFGKGESSLTAQLPLMVKPSLPRFLRFGDTVELPVMVHNQTDKSLTVDVALRGDNIELVESGKRVTVNGNDRVEVRFKAKATQPGTTTIQMAASAGDYSDASEQSLPVYTPATTEAFATYGVVDGNTVILQPVEKPKDIFDQFGDLEVTTSSTALQSLTDAYHYLEDYDYACSEQLSARLLSMLALRDVMAAFKTQSSKDKATTTRLMNEDIRHLLARQRYKGDFGLWKEGDREDWPYASIQVTRALIVAKQKGFNVPQENLEKAFNYLRNIENYVRRPDYSEEAVKSLQCYAQYVLNMSGQLQIEEARTLLAHGLQELKPGSKQHDRTWWYNDIIDNMESAAWLSCALAKDPASKNLVAQTKRLIESRIDETASTADVLGGSYGDCNYRMFYCPKRLNAVVLEALMTNDPQNPVIPKLVNGLLGSRHKGRWESTQENFNVLLALDKYFNTYEKLTPEFRLNMWVGNSFAGKQEFKGRSTVSKVLTVPMAYVTKQDKGDVTIQKDGQGRLYYRIGLRYAPKDLSVAALDRGFTVTRTYEAVDHKTDVRRDKDGTWHVAAGAQVRVNLEMQAPSARYHVALNDPIPAGCEISNPALKGNKQSTQTQPWTWWFWNWYEHHNLKDDRAEVFASTVWGGTYKYSYIMRATTPGTYQVPPTKAEEMYAPETFGRCASDLVIVD